MHLLLTYTILGLVTGAVYGIAASGLVLTYTTSGIFNFAQGAMAMLAAFTYWQFRYGWNWPAPLALFTVLVVLAPLLGIVLYVVIMRGLRQTADVTKIVVTIGIMLGLIALAQWIWNPGVPRTDQLFFGNAAKFKFLGVYVTDHEAIALGCGVLIAVGIRLLFTSTRTGVAMRAVVDNPALLQLNGGRPERLAAFSWALGGALAALAGILITPISGGTLDVHVLTLLVLDSIAAAMFGRLRSIWLTFAGALVLGLASTYVLGYFPESWEWASNFRIALPDDRALRGPDRAATGPAAGGDAAAHQRAIHRPDHPLRRDVGRHPAGRRAGPRTGHGLQRHGVADRRDHLRHHRPVADPAHRIRRRDQPGAGLFRGDRHHHRVPPRPLRIGAHPADHALGTPPRHGRHGGRGRPHRPAGSAPARPLSGARHPGVRRLRLRHDHRRHCAARACPSSTCTTRSSPTARCRSRRSSSVRSTSARRRRSSPRRPASSF